MKFNFSSIEVERIVAGILERINVHEQGDSKNVKEKEYISRLIELRGKIILGEVWLTNRREISLLAGIINSEVWNKLSETYRKFYNYSSLDFLNLSDFEKDELERLEKIILLCNRFNRSTEANKKELFLPKLRFHEKLKSNLNGEWYYSHNQGKLYKFALKINEKEYIEIKKNERNQIPEMVTFPINMSYLSTFMKSGTKTDILNLVVENKKQNDLDNINEFVFKIINACG